jgi:hypothetical protein
MVFIISHFHQLVKLFFFWTIKFVSANDTEDSPGGNMQPDLASAVNIDTVVNEAISFFI